MMSDQLQNLSHRQEPVTKNASGRKPAIRTMKSDVEELFKSTKPSLVQIIGKETAAAPERKIRSAKTSRQILTFILAAFLILGAAGAAYFLISSRSVEKPPPKLVPPAPFFATETSRTLETSSADRALFLRLMEDSIKEFEREGTIKRISVKLRDGPQERFATADDFFGFYRINPPSGFLRTLERQFMTFIYYGRGESRIGLAMRTREPDRTWRDFIAWESTLLRDFAPLFFDEKAEVVIAPFEDRTYRNIDWRFLKLSQSEDLGIGYTVFPAGNVAVMTTSKEAMETVINRLFDAR